VSETVAGLLRAADDELDAILAGTLEPGYRARGHRGVMELVKAAVVLHLHPGSRWAGNDDVLARAGRWLTELEGLQAPSGLFSSGDNLASPPDSAFTITDVAAVTELLRRDDRPGLGGLRARLVAVLEAAAPALLVGGVHTPNHRWELAGALARTGALLGDEALLDRARTWLAEGVDVDPDGIYSERSPNYAAYVSNPSLTALGDLLGRDDLHEVVHRNLHAQLDLTDAVGVVETVHSRRQDQNDPYPLGPFLGQLRRAAIRQQCARCAAGARRAALAPGVGAVEVLAQQLAQPDLAGPLPQDPAPAPPARRYFAGSRLLVDRREDAWFTVYGGSDVPAVGRVASGLACNPTFLRATLGGVGVRSVRLSRDFFGLGPFRASQMSVSDHHVTLVEDVSAAYYQPLVGAAVRPDARYDLEHEGRFAGSMSFSQRARDEVTLRTTVEVDLQDDRVDLRITTAGAATAHCLELALGPGGTLTGATALDDERSVLTGGTATYQVDGQALVVGPVQGADPDQPVGYHPGEAYTFLHGTDALGGTRLYVGWRSPGTVALSLRRG